MVIDPVEFLFADKVSAYGQDKNLCLSQRDKQIIFGVRKYIETKGCYVSMPQSAFLRMVGISSERSSFGFLLSKFHDARVLMMNNPMEIGEHDDVVIFGVSELVLTSRTGQEYIFPKVMSEEVPERIRKRCEIQNEYYVYVCKEKDKVVYVGKGVGKRLAHCRGSSTSNTRLKDLSAQGVDLVVEKVAESLTAEMAIELENCYMNALIKSGHTLCNKAMPTELRGYLDEVSGIKEAFVF